MERYRLVTHLKNVYGDEQEYVEYFNDYAEAELEMHRAIREVTEDLLWDGEKIHLEVIKTDECKSAGLFSWNKDGNKEVAIACYLTDLNKS